MAGDWIKIRCNLDEDYRVQRIADLLNEPDVDYVVGKLWRLWRYADQHTTDGVIPYMTPAGLDRIVNRVGFSDALAAVGWLQIEPERVSIPRFDEHNGASAKRRAMNAKRMALNRARGHLSVVPTKS